MLSSEARHVTMVEEHLRSWVKSRLSLFGIKPAPHLQQLLDGNPSAWITRLRPLGRPDWLIYAQATLAHQYA